MLRILIVDDNPNDRILALCELNREFPDLNIMEITEEKQFQEVLVRGNFDLAVTDYKLCWSDGLAVFRAIKHNFPQCPVIMFTDSGNEEVAVEGMKAGLSDYVLKRQHFRRLSVAVRRCLEQQRIYQEYTDAIEQLRVNQESFSLAQAAANIGIWDWDLQRNSLTWNQNHERLFGLSVGSFDGSYEMFISCVHPEDRDLINQSLQQALENKIHHHQEFRIVLPDGSIRWMVDRGLFFDDASGKVTRATGIVLDITDRKEREVALERHAKGLEEAYQLQDEFLSLVSHELRTPLNAILGWTHLLQKYQFDEATRNQRLESIERNLKRQQHLIEQILDTSRLKEGQMQLECASVDLKSTIENAIESERLAIIAKSIRLETKLDSSVGRVLGDKKRLQQVVWNLLSNAIKFTPKGGQVTVSLETVDEDAKITVNDTGQGISPEFLPYVFHQFRQQDASRTRSHQGAGLGLTIVRHLVELHGGSVGVASPGVGGGATFTVKLPLLEEENANFQINQSIINTESSVFSPSLQGLKVLVVDDEPDTLALLVVLLESEGATVTAVNGANQALQVLPEFKPDILISDLVMPEIDGYTLLEYVKLLQPTWNQPLKTVAITGHDRTEPSQKALKAGFQVSISKPIEPQELVTVIGMLAQSS
jgi:PAS domain S-box-containing protein